MTAAMEVELEPIRHDPSNQSDEGKAAELGELSPEEGDDRRVLVDAPSPLVLPPALLHRRARLEHASPRSADPASFFEQCRESYPRTRALACTRVRAFTAASKCCTKKVAQPPPTGGGCIRALSGSGVSLHAVILEAIPGNPTKTK